MVFKIAGPDGGDIDDVFITDSEVIDRYVGKELWVWGDSTAGELGDNSVVKKSSPVQTVARGTDWIILSDGNGLDCAAAIKTDGSLWVWGGNAYGRLGDNTVVPKSSPVQTITGGNDWTQISTGWYHSAAIKTDGTLWGWGHNTYGQLSDNTIVKKSSPVQTIAGGTDWKQVSCGFWFTAAIKNDGTMWTWGRNNVGQLGDNTLADKSSPIQTVAGGSDWNIMSSGSAYVSSIKTDGTIWVWGSNNNGQLGDNSLVDKSSPVQLADVSTNWKSISCGYQHTAAIKTDGTLWLWGLDVYGQLGDNALARKSSPVETISSGTNWKQVSSGNRTTAAIKTDGTLWMWGNNGDGQLGDNTILKKSSPVQTIAGGTNWKQASCKHTTIMAVKIKG